MKNNLALKKTSVGKSLGREMVYSPAPEDSSHIKINKRYDLFIGGKNVRTKKYFKTINPSNEKVLAEVSYADGKDVERAVSSARKAYDNYWKNLPARERGKYIFRIARILQEKAREFSIIESMDGGKPIRESRLVDVPLAIAHFFYYAGWADKLHFDFHGLKTEPNGVAGQIIP